MWSSPSRRRRKWPGIKARWSRICFPNSAGRPTNGRLRMRSCWQRKIVSPTAWKRYSPKAYRLAQNSVVKLWNLSKNLVTVLKNTNPWRRHIPSAKSTFRTSSTSRTSKSCQMTKNWPRNILTSTWPRCLSQQIMFFFEFGTMIMLFLSVFQVIDTVLLNSSFPTCHVSKWQVATCASSLNKLVEGTKGHLKALTN